MEAKKRPVMFAANLRTFTGSTASIEGKEWQLERGREGTFFYKMKLKDLN